MKRSVALALVVLAAALTACSGSSGSTGGGGSPTPTTAATAPADAAAARSQISANWQKFFQADTPRATSIRLLENGASLGTALKKAEQEDAAAGGKRSATVTNVVFTSPSQASVSYRLAVAGRTLNASGVAVLQDGTWKVSENTFCGLVVLGNAERPVKGCPS